MPDTMEPQLDELRRRARRRLVGAIVLALAAAVIVPMLLESNPKPLGEDVSVKIPPVDEGKFVSKVPERSRAPDVAVVPPIKPAPSAAPDSAPAKDVATIPPLTPAPAKEPAVEPPKVASRPATDETRKPSPSQPAFAVQLAAFADDKGANALANRLKKSGHPAYTEAYNTSRGTLWRVRVGPYPTREAAESARTKLKADGQNGIIAAAN
jgi:DedD protein